MLNYMSIIQLEIKAVQVVKKLQTGQFHDQCWKMLRLGIAQFGSYYVRGAGFPLVDSCKDSGILVIRNLNFIGIFDP